jgi:hypothetical protein
MKKIVKMLVVMTFIATLVSCMETFNATETLQVDENRNAIYQEIISNPIQFTNFISESQKSEEAKKILIKSNIVKMEPGDIKMIMDKNPEMIQMMQSERLDQMMASKEGCKLLMDEIYKNKIMKKEMEAKMLQMMDENPEMIKKIKGKIKNIR